MTVEVGRMPEERDSRLIFLTNAFGRVLFETARAPARARASALPEDVRSQVEELLDGQLYAVLQLLDGVPPRIHADAAAVEFVLKARVRDRATDAVLDEVELGPDGEGLCMGFAGWVAEDFGSDG